MDGPGQHAQPADRAEARRVRADVGDQEQQRKQGEPKDRDSARHQEVPRPPPALGQRRDPALGPWVPGGTERQSWGSVSCPCRREQTRRARRGRREGRTTADAEHGIGRALVTTVGTGSSERDQRCIRNQLTNRCLSSYMLCQGRQKRRRGSWFSSTRGGVSDRFPAVKIGAASIYVQLVRRPGCPCGRALASCPCFPEVHIT